MHRSVNQVLRRLACRTICILSAISTELTLAAPGDLDFTFGQGTGKVVTTFSTPAGPARSVAVRSDGRLVVVGDCLNGANSDFCLARYNQDGTLDVSFNGNGRVMGTFGNTGAIANGIALHSDGKIVASGRCWTGSGEDICAARYNADGSLDVSFNTTGKVITPFGGGNAFDTGDGVAIQYDGKIVVAGRCRVDTNYRFCIVRYNVDGSLDSTFGSAGKVTTQIGGTFDSASSVAIQPNGRIVVAGNCVASQQNFCLSRYHADGTLDVSLAGTGKVLTVINTAAIATSVALQPDDKIILAGRCWNGVSYYDFCLARYNADGSADRTLNGNGFVVAPATLGNNEATGVSVQADGKIVLVGNCGSFCLARFNSDGSLDRTLNGTGKVVTPIGGAFPEPAYAVVVQPDGKIVAAGSCSDSNTPSSTSTFCIVRYEGGPFGYKSCSMDIDGDGRVLATTDSLIHARIALGLIGPAVTNGIAFAASATRNTWPLIRDYLVSHCGIPLPH